MKENEFNNSSKDYNDEDIEDLLVDIKKSLASQISEQLDLEKENDVNDDYEDENDIVDESPKKKMPKWLKVSSIVFGSFLGLALILVLVFSIYTGRLNRKFNNDLKAEYDETDDLTDFSEMDPSEIKWDKYLESAKKVDGVVNILLVGEEAIGENNQARGRTDSIMIATINSRAKALKLTSIMRDTYVQIPEYKDNKINAAYNFGGMQLLKDTIELNFDVKIDGSVLVNFDGFEKIIDLLGGVEIELTEDEAKYLQTTNYISKKENRNVVAGKNLMNGNQALGYARVRKRATLDGTNNDFGRTSRHRVVLEAIFNKYKTKNFAELATIMYDILPLVTTDISNANLVNYLATVATMGTTELETYRIPVDNGYYGAKIRGMSVLVPDLNVNNAALHNFIFASKEELEKLENE